MYLAPLLRKFTRKSCVVLLSVFIFSSNILGVANINNGALAILPPLFDMIHAKYIRHKAYMHKDPTTDLEEFCIRMAPIYSSVYVATLVEVMAVVITNMLQSISNKNMSEISSNELFKMLTYAKRVFENTTESRLAVFVNTITFRFPELKNKMVLLDRSISIMNTKGVIEKDSNLLTDQILKTFAREAGLSFNSDNLYIRNYAYATLLAISWSYLITSVFTSISECSKYYDGNVMEEVIRKTAIIQNNIETSLAGATDVSIIKDIVESLMQHIDGITASDVIKGCNMLECAMSTASIKLFNDYCLQALPYSGDKLVLPKPKKLFFEDNAMFVNVQVCAMLAVSILFAVNDILENISDWGFSDVEIAIMRLKINRASSLEEGIKIVLDTIIKKLQDEDIDIGVIRDTFLIFSTTLSYVQHKLLPLFHA